MGNSTSIAIQGIKFDDKSSFQKGPSLAPPLIRQALNDGSMNLYAENGKDINQLNIVDKGDFEVEDYTKIESITYSNIQGVDKILTLGGDHSITYPIIKAILRRHQTLDILQIDAHCDLYDSFEGDKYSHACPFARIMETERIGKLVQVGIRTLTAHQLEQADKFQVEVHEMKDFKNWKIQKFKNPLYISFDLDGLDPAYAPGVSHHEPGGLSTRQTIDILQNLDADIIGADIVEYNPNRDLKNMTAYVGAKLMKELLSLMT